MHNVCVIEISHRRAFCTPLTVEDAAVPPSERSPSWEAGDNRAREAENGEEFVVLGAEDGEDVCCLARRSVAIKVPGAAGAADVPG